MTASGPVKLPSIGFLTIVRAEQGALGGYLVLNALGRPLEFHCTAPVRPNRAQEILFGPALETFLYGEQIAQTLIKKSKLQPSFVCTDQESVGSVRPLISCPLLWVRDHDADSPTFESTSVESSDWRGWVSRDHGADAEKIEAVWASYRESLDLAEPFERIREAIEEAQRGKRQAG